MKSKTITISTDNIHNQTEKTNIDRTIRIPNSSYYYQDKYNENWVDDNPMLYSMNIAFENHICDVLGFPLDRVLYASNDNTFYKREEKNNGNLNLPYFSYYMTGYSDPDRDWWNNFANLEYPMSHDNAAIKIGQKIKIFPVKIEYEGVACFSQHKDMDYAFKQLAYDDSNETILFPTIETSKGDTIKNIGILSWDIEYNPSFNEQDWLTKNKIFTIGVNFSLDTFLIVGDLESDMFITKSVMLDFIIAKKNLIKPNIYNSDPKLVISEYFNPDREKNS